MLFMNNIKNIAIYCGANTGKDPLYLGAIDAIGNAFLKNDLTLIYGGANVGLMGSLANDILKKMGRVIGVIPQALVDLEKAHHALTKLYIVNSMHQRKELISDLSDGFILMPGGIGSLDEFFEIFTWQQLGHITKPCGILNINNYYRLIIEFLNQAVGEGFLKKEHLDAIYVEKDINTLIDQFKAYKPLKIEKWIQ